MGFLLHHPSPPLDRLIAAMWSTDFAGEPSSIPGLIAPDAHAEFVFHLGPPCEMQRVDSSEWLNLPAAMLFALRSKCVRLRPTGPGAMIAVRTSAVVASAILRQPLRELWDEPVELRHVLGAGIETLCERLFHSPPSQRFQLLERWLVSRLEAWTTHETCVESLHEHLVWLSRGASIARIAARAGMSVRTMRRWIGESAGLSPKQLEVSGRVLRACALLQERRDLSVTDIAFRLGFTDHAAFSHAFRDITALSPSALRSEPLVFFTRTPAHVGA